jgi:hypothetical protein
MRPDEALKRIPAEGFLKLTREASEMPPQTRSALVRKGNELLNEGKHELAKRVFLTAGYADGLVRIGEYYEEQGEALEAFRMFWLARYRKKIDPAVERMAHAVRHWLEQTPGGTGGTAGEHDGTKD